MDKEKIILVNPFFEVYGHDFGYMVHFLIIYGVAKLYSIYKNKINPKQKLGTSIPSLFMTFLLVLLYRILPHYKLPLVGHLTPSNMVFISALAGFVTEEIFANFNPRVIVQLIIEFLKFISMSALRTKYGKGLKEEDVQKLLKVLQEEKTGSQSVGKEGEEDVKKKSVNGVVKDDGDSLYESEGSGRQTERPKGFRRTK